MGIFHPIGAMKFPERTLNASQCRRFAASLDRIQLELQKVLHETDIDTHLYRHAKRALTHTGTLSWLLTKAGYAEQETSE